MTSLGNSPESSSPHHAYLLSCSVYLIKNSPQCAASSGATEVGRQPNDIGQDPQDCRGSSICTSDRSQIILGVPEELGMNRNEAYDDKVFSFADLGYEPLHTMAVCGP